MEKNYGFKEPIITEDNYFLGGVTSLPKVIIRPNGDWSEFIPEFEPQRIGFETYNCTAFATLKCIQILEKEMGIENNYSDRFVGTMAGTSDRGNDPHTVAQAIRHSGLILEKMLPFYGQSVSDYYSFMGGDKDKCLKAGQDWLKKNDFGHEYVFKGKVDHNKMMECLRYSPLGVSVNAWKMRNGLYYKEEGERDNHWTTAVVGYVKDKYWKISDTYIVDGKPTKKLEWDYDFKWCKRYSLKKKTTHQLSLMQKLCNYFHRLKTS